MSILLDIRKNDISLILLIVVLLLLGELLSSCSPRVTSQFSSQYSAVADTVDIMVLPLGTDIPDEAEVLGTVSIGDSGLTPPSKGTYEKVISLASQEARSAGGNALLVTRHQLPDIMYSTHRMEFKVLKIDKPILSAPSEKVSSHPDYAVLYLYRPFGSGPLVSYDVYLDDTKVFHSRVGHKCEVKIRSSREMTLHAATESRTDYPLDIKLGEEYYVRCGVSIGIIVGRPAFEQVLPGIGRAEYDAMQEND